MIQAGDLLNKRYRVLKELKPGGFARIFEVRDIRQRNLKNGFGLLRERSIKILKVLNQFGNRQQDAEFLFRREISLLKQLDHPAVVRYADDFDLIQDQRIIPCLVMEKVPGVTIEEWLQENGAVSEEIALDWLLQFAEVLNYLHNDQRVMHLDIKPANVMVTPRGELVLIDFGIARPISSTLLAKLIDSGETMQHRAATDWFSAPEQLQGKPTPQSDLYSLGRTMIYAATNTSLEYLEDDEGYTNWLDSTVSFSNETYDLIKLLTNYEVRERYSTVEELIAKIHYLHREKNRYYCNRLYAYEAVKFLLISTIIVFLVSFLGSLKPFQEMELLVFDHFVRTRIDTEGPDNNITIIKVTSQDAKYMRQHGMPEDISMSDYFLNKLLSKIQKYDPSVIGIDIYGRDVSLVQKKNILIGNCLNGNIDTGEFVRSPTRGISPDQLGFTDIVEDRHLLLDKKVVRRSLIGRQATEHCPANFSFAYKVAKTYLESKGFIVKDNAKELQVGSVVFPRLQSNQFLYNDFDDRGYQIALNYRRYENVSNSYSLLSILEEDSPEKLENILEKKMVLIGTFDESYDDVVLTPYGKMPGVVLQAHAISQIVSSTINDRKNWIFFTRSENTSWLFVWCTVFNYSFLLLPIKKEKLFFLLLLLFYVINTTLVSLSIYFPATPILLILILIFLARLKTKKKNCF